MPRASKRHYLSRATALRAFIAVVVAMLFIFGMALVYELYSWGPSAVIVVLALAITLDSVHLYRSQISNGFIIFPSRGLPALKVYRAKSPSGFYYILSFRLLLLVGLWACAILKVLNL